MKESNIKHSASAPPNLQLSIDDRTYIIPYSTITLSIIDASCAEIFCAAGMFRLDFAKNLSAMQAVKNHLSSETLVSINNDDKIKISFMENP